MAKAFRIMLEIAPDVDGVIPEWWDWAGMLDLPADSVRLIDCREIRDFRFPPDFDLSRAERPENNR